MGQKLQYTFLYVPPVLFISFLEYYKTSTLPLTSISSYVYRNLVNYRLAGDLVSGNRTTRCTPFSDKILYTQTHNPSLTTLLKTPAMQIYALI